MAYNLVPDANNTVGSDLTAMYDNFVALESAQIVDSGSTADGDYVRWENGLQVCWYTYRGDITISGLVSDFDYPATFVATPSGGGVITDANLTDRELIWQNNLTAVAYTSTNWVIFGANDGTYNIDKSNFYAIGRWK